MRSWLVIAAATVAASACKKPAPQADPELVKERARTMLKNSPAPAAVPTCTPAQLAAGATIGQVALLRLAGEEVSDTPERADWINPTELDPPAARVLLDPKASTTAQRQAAAQVLAQPQLVVLRIDLVHVPMALGLKELKRGTVGARALVYDRRGISTCMFPFTFANDRKLAEDAMVKSDKAVIDPEIVKLLRDDLKVQLLAKVAELRAGAAK